MNENPTHYCRCPRSAHKPSSTQVDATMSRCCNVYREEFRLHKLSFNYHDNTVFYTCHWRIPHILFVLIRFALFACTIFGLTYFTMKCARTMMKFFTAWSFIMLTVHMGLSAFLTLLVYRENISSPLECQKCPKEARSTKTEFKNTFGSSPVPESQPVTLLAWGTTIHDRQTHSTLNHGIDNTSCELEENINADVDHASTEAENKNNKENNKTPLCPDTTATVNITADTQIRQTIVVNFPPPCHTQCGAPLATSQHRHLQSNDKTDHDGTLSTPWYFKTSWCMSTIASLSAPIVTIIYFVAIHPHTSHPTDINLHDANVHILNLVFVIVDQLISRRPVRVLHFYVCFIYGMLYCIFCLIYWTQDHENNVIYKIMDWNKPGKATAVCLGLILTLPLLQSLYFGLYRFKLILLKHIYS